MSPGTLETDYLIIGAGAMGMAFADALFDLTGAHITLVDRRHRPGGHWNDAYGFVRLHQPSVFYGVNSRELGSGRVDRAGLNRGMSEMASGAEVLDHFDQLLHQRLLPSGRVAWLPMTEHRGVDADGHHQLHSLLDGRRQAIRVRRKVVHATHTGTEVPSTRPPAYTVGAGVRCVPPNDLPRIRNPHARYTVVGSGKTGIDTCLWLLQNGIAPARIRWIMPNDAWFMDRANVQPGVHELPRFFGSIARQFECIADAESLPHLFELLERCGELVRLDPAVRPTRYRCATISQGELRELRRITNVVRLGRVQAVTRSHLTLEHGMLDVLEDELFVDCSACAIPSRPGVPVFEGDGAIHLQLVRTCAPCFSAAFIAAVECLVPADDRNNLCRVVPLPAGERSWLAMWAVSLANRRAWSRHDRLMAWLADSRLDYGTRVREQVPADVMARYLDALKRAAPRLQPLLEGGTARRERPAAMPAH